MKNFSSVLYLLSLLLLLLFTSLLLTTINCQIPQVNITNEIVLGQSDFISNMEGITLWGLNNPHQVSVIMDQIIVSDLGNNRILAYNKFNLSMTNASASTCINCNDTNSKGGYFSVAISVYTTDSSAYVWAGDGNSKSYHRYRYPFSSNQMPDLYLNSTTFYPPARIIVDANNSVFYAVDGLRNRILKYPMYNTSGYPLAIYGQGSLDGNQSNQGLANPTAITLNQPLWAFMGCIPGEFWIVDTSNHRILRFPTPLTNISDLVLGQSDFTTNNTNQLQNPFAAVMNHDCSQLWVTDSFYNRIVLYKAPFYSGMKPDAKLDQDWVLHQTRLILLRVFHWISTQTPCFLQIHFFFFFKKEGDSTDLLSWVLEYGEDFRLSPIVLPSPLPNTANNRAGELQRCKRSVRRRNRDVGGCRNGRS